MGVWKFTPSNVPKTGDSSLVLWSVLGLLSAAAALVILRKKQREL